MSPTEHAEQAKRLLDSAERLLDPEAASTIRESTLAAARAALLAEANVHATLAVYGRLSRGLP